MLSARAARIAKIAERQTDLEELLMGPPVAAAFGADGSPTPAAIGFARKNNIDAALLERVETPKGTYLAYSPQWTLESGRSTLAMGVIEPGVRQIAKNWFKHLLRKPLDARKKLHFQSIMMIQPIDVLEDGRQNMCDGCPDVAAREPELI